jgi:hypothetical protein
MVYNMVPYDPADLPEGRVPQISHLTEDELLEATPLLSHNEVGLLLQISMAWGVLPDRMP